MLIADKENDLYSRYIKDEIKPLLNKRIKEVKENKVKPDFNKGVV